MFYIQIIVLKG